MASGHLCRDCLRRWQAPEPEGRCPGCRSARIVAHPELHDLAIAHLDCDAFYAAVEQRDDPALAGQPLIIGGGRRGVVSTCSYEARPFGVHSAMPMFQALKLCPQALVRPPNMAKYVAESKRIRALMNELTPLVEPVSIDEAFLDLSGTQGLHGQSAAQCLAALARRIEADIRITVSIGLSHNKFLAKVASELDKPRGFSVIGRVEATAFLAPKPVRLIWGIGPAFERRLAHDGISTISDVQLRDEVELARRYGKMGRQLYRLARGEDGRRVMPRMARKSLSSERTLEQNVADGGELERLLWHACERVARGLKKEGLAGRTITLKLKTADFKLLTRSRSLDQPTASADVVYEIARDLLVREVDGTRFRLIGVGVAGFSEPATEATLDLFSTEHKRDDVDDAVTAIRDRFGADAITRGRGLAPPGSLESAGDD